MLTPRLALPRPTQSRKRSSLPPKCSLNYRPHTTNHPLPENSATALSMFTDRSSQPWERRGSNTTTPTFYGISSTRLLAVKLRVQHGQDGTHESPKGPNRPKLDSPLSALEKQSEFFFATSSADDFFRNLDRSWLSGKLEPYTSENGLR